MNKLPEHLQNQPTPVIVSYVTVQQLREAGGFVVSSEQVKEMPLMARDYDDAIRMTQLFHPGARVYAVRRDPDRKM